MLLHRRPVPEPGMRRETGDEDDRNAGHRSAAHGSGQDWRLRLDIAWLPGLCVLPRWNGLCASRGHDLRLCGAKSQVTRPAICRQFPFPIALARKYPEILATLFTTLAGRS